MAEFNDIPGNLSFAASEAVRRNAGNSAFETFVPSGASLSYSASNLSGDVTLTDANTWYDVLSHSLAAGTWYLFAYATFAKPATLAAVHQLRITDGTTHYASGVNSHDSLNPHYVNMAVTAVIVLGSTTTIKSQGLASTTSCLVKAATVDYGSGNNATGLIAIKIG